jgi:hypothetical protein
MDVFKEYKPLRNRIALLARDDSLAVVWAYGQYLQIDDFKFPNEVQVLKKFLDLDIPQRWVSEWELELLAKEVILNGGLIAVKGRSLCKWDTFSEYVNSVKSLEQRIYGALAPKGQILVELIRIAHRQFIWQGNPPNSASIIRQFKIFNSPSIDEICLERVGLTVWQIYMCGVALMGSLLTHPAVDVEFKSDIKALPPEVFDKFFLFASLDISKLRTKLKAEQKYNLDFAYAYSSLRAYPLVRMFFRGKVAFVCPMMTLLFWKFTSGLYYELISDPRFANEFGDGFQRYVGHVIESACQNPEIKKIEEFAYFVGKQEKRSVDWIVYDENSVFFLECKSKRLSWGAKSSLIDLAPLDADIDTMAAAVVQVYKTLCDYESGLYPDFQPKEGRKIYIGVVTPENWRMFGPVMFRKLDDAVAKKLQEVELPVEMAQKWPYTIWAIEELESGLQIMDSAGIAEFMDGKIKDREMREWDWLAYMSNNFSKHFPLKKLFDKEYDDMFSELYVAQKG